MHASHVLIHPGIEVNEDCLITEWLTGGDSFPCPPGSVKIGKFDGEERLR